MRIAGYAAIFDCLDKGGDVIRRGAFANAPPSLPLYWQHDPVRRIGTVDKIEEDERGLRIVATVDNDTTPVTPGSGLSFGYRARQFCNGTFRELNEVELIEVSVVRHPMQPLARVLAVQPEA